MIATYEAVFNEEDVSGVFGISLVESPATQEYFIQLSEDEKKAIKEKATEIKLATANEEQRILVGLVLEPNKPVYRNQDGEEFNIVFNQETIKNLAHSFFMNDYHKNSTIEHDMESKISDVAFVESWTVADPKKDKSNVYGMEYPVGSWVIAMKVKSDEVWNDYVKTGKVKGFSIDAVVKLKKINKNKKLSMAQTIKEKLIKAANDFAVKMGVAQEPVEVKPEEPIEVKFGQIEMEGGEIIFEYEGEVLEPGVNVFAIAKDGEEGDKIPVPVGDYPLMDGKILVITEEGIVGEVKGGEVEEPAATEEPAPVMEAASESETAQQIKSILIKYDEMDKKLEKLDKLDKLDAIDERLGKVEEEVLEFSEQPKEKPVAMMAQPLNKKGRLLQQIRHNN